MKTIDMTPSWSAAVRIYCAVLLNPKASPKAHADAEADLMRLAKVVDDLYAADKGDDDLCGHKSQLYVDTYCIKKRGHLCAHQWPKKELQRADTKTCGDGNADNCPGCWQCDDDDLPALLRNQAE